MFYCVIVYEESDEEVRGVQVAFNSNLFFRATLLYRRFLILIRHLSVHISKCAWKIYNFSFYFFPITVFTVSDKVPLK